MYFQEFGQKGRPIVVLLAPMMVTGEELYGIMAPFFQGSYHFIAPDQGGHGKAGAYVSAREEVATLKKLLLKNGYQRIALIYGASLGVSAGYPLFVDPEFRVGAAWFDGTCLSRHAYLAQWFMKRLFRSRKRSMEKEHIEASENLVKMYGYEFGRRMTKNFERITPEDIDAICHACCHYELRELTDGEQSRLHLDFGEKDIDLRYARKSIKRYMPQAELTIREGYPHCGYMATHPKEYVGELEKFMLSHPL